MVQQAVHFGAASGTPVRNWPSATNVQLIGSALAGQREIDRKRTSFADLTYNVDEATILAHEFKHDGQAQSAAVTILRRKQRLKDTRLRRVVYALTVVPHAHNGIVSRRQLTGGNRRWIINGASIYTNRNVTAWAYRIPCIDDQIQDDLRDLSFVRFDNAWLRADLRGQVDTTAGESPQHALRSADERY